MAGASAARPDTWLVRGVSVFGEQLTVALHISSVDACTSNKDFIDNCEDAFTTNPFSIVASDPGVVKHGSLI